MPLLESHICLASLQHDGLVVTVLAMTLADYALFVFGPTEPSTEPYTHQALNKCSLPEQAKLPNIFRIP